MKLVVSTMLVMLVAIAPAANATAHERSVSPSALYHALLAESVSGELPAGFHSARTGAYELTDQARKHHAVGGVEIDVDRNAAIIYLVYPTRADAVADWREANVKRHATGSRLAPGRFPWPAIVFNYSIVGKDVAGKTVTHGITDLAFTSHNVIVQSMTMSTDNKESGNLRGSIRLGDFALKHLNLLRR